MTNQLGPDPSDHSDWLLDGHHSRKGQSESLHGVWTEGYLETTVPLL